MAAVDAAIIFWEGSTMSCVQVCERCGHLFEAPSRHVDICGDCEAALVMDRPINGYGGEGDDG